MKLVLLVLSVFVALPLYAEEFNAGFVEGLWYDNDHLFAGEQTRIYVAIRNHTGADLTGTVEFFDNDKRIERNNVSALDGRIIESWADWVPAYGTHTITATLSRIELHKIGSSTQAVEVVSALAEDVIFVDYDTDKDGVGNEDDTDDDGDGVPDQDEEENGTDPLDANDPEQNDVTNDDSNIQEEENQTDDSSDKEHTSSHEPQGLEQFLTESRADSVLGSVTQTVNNTKKKLDEYRASRNADHATTSTSSAQGTSSGDVQEYGNGFGEVTRSKEEDRGFLASVLDFAKTLLKSIYTLILFLLSLYLAHPILVQLTLLFLILFLIYKLAKRYGSRPQ